MINMTSQLMLRQGVEVNSLAPVRGDVPDPVRPRNESWNVDTQEVRIRAETQSVTDLADAVNQVNDYLQSNQRGLRFSVDESSGRTVVQVINTETDEVIRQMPSEEMMVLIRRFGESTAMIFDETV